MKIYYKKGEKIYSKMFKNIINDNLFYERVNQIENFIEEISELKSQKIKKNELMKNESNDIKKNYKN